MKYKVNTQLIYGGKLYNIGDDISILEPTTLEVCLKDNLIVEISEEIISENTPEEISEKVSKSSKKGK
ncbi:MULTISPECIES: hypothetical protein [Streptobacillus]|uniref:hypothetical protein n=1 Tax=Streptobacillus TaxID=34104 RepID=UPI0007E4BFE9|nr:MULTISPECIES: hypothetical protein [Streptobacillus]